MTTRTDDIRSIAPRMPNAFCPMPGVATGGQPSAAELEAFARAGYRTVLDIRAPGEPRGYDERPLVEKAGLQYVSLPVGHGPLTDETFDRFRALLRDADRQPILVHCASGNRVGLMMIPYLVLDEGKTPQDAVRIATQVGLSSPQLASLALDYIARHGASKAAPGRVA